MNKMISPLVITFSMLDIFFELPEFCYEKNIFSFFAFYSQLYLRTRLHMRRWRRAGRL